MATVNAVKSEVSVDFVRLKKGLHDLNSLLVYHELGHLISEYGPELFATQVYPQMLNNFDLTLWPKHPWPEMGHQLLLDLLTDRLKQFLLHAKPAKHQKVIIVLGYRSGMISKRIIQALLLANILSAHGMRIIFTSSVQNLENIVDIAKQHSKSLVITSSSIDGFYQNLLLNTLGESGQKNIMAYAPKWPDKNSHCLPEDLAKVFAVVKKAMEEL
jgi:methylmalonyl-CoA mutase cobalamin-binding subunit